MRDRRSRTGMLLSLGAAFLLILLIRDPFRGLKRFADRHSICIVTVHHTRKQPAGDSFETISGTTGLLGCADGALLMQKKKRTALEATVDAVGRDQQDQILYLKKDADTQIWSLERTENEPYQAVSYTHLDVYKRQLQI